MPKIPPEATAERALVLKTLFASVDALAAAIGNNTEIVVHDLTNPSSSVLKIANGHVSGRAVGDSMFSGPDGDLGFAGLLSARNAASPSSEPLVIADYTTVTAKGTKLKSATTVYRDAAGVAFASLCINVDLSDVEIAHAALGRLLRQYSSENTPQNAQTDLESMMEEIIDSSLSQSGRAGKPMNKREKLEAVRVMQDRGMFIVKGGVEKAASKLGVTRYTIYNYLDEIKKSGGDE